MSLYLMSFHSFHIFRSFHLLSMGGKLFGDFLFCVWGILFWILGWTRSVCYFQHFGVGNCYNLTYSQHFGVRCSLFPCHLQHFGRSVCYFQHFGVGNETVTTAAPPMSKTRKAE